MPPPLRILIVGGGIAGLALGRALRIQGFAPEIIERAPSWPGRGTGLYIPGNGVRALEELGLAGPLRARAVCVSHQRLLNHTGGQLAEIELAPVWTGVGACVGIAREELHRILLEGAADVPAGLGTTVTTLRQQDGGVDLSFSDGSTGTYDLVIGADGIHSSIRQRVLGNIRPRRLGQVSWRFLADQPGANEAWTAMLASRRAFLAVPVGPNRLYCYADLTTSATEDPTGRDLNRLRALFADFGEPARSILGKLDSFDAIHFSPIEEVVVDRATCGRVVLVGDAAHATSPNMAEGASMALEDAVVLAESLRTNGSLQEALSAFRSRRQPRVRWVQRRTRRRDRIRALPAPLRNLALRWAGTAIYRRDYGVLFDRP